MSAPISQADWEKFRRDSIEIMPELAEKLGLPAVLLPYQSKAVGLIDSTAMRVLFIEKSRRIGLTWGLASYAVLRAGRKKSARGMDVLYISYKQEIAKEFVDVCGMWARAFAVAAADVDEMMFDDTNPENPQDTRQIQTYRIRFASGFQILALSSAPRSLRGQQGDVIIDEAAFVDSLKELMKAALAMRMWGGKVIVCSTHDGVDNPFNEYIKDIASEKSKYQHMKVDLDQALVDGLFRRMCLVNAEEWSPEYEAQWRQDVIDDYQDGADEELFCIPAMGSGAWLTAPLIEARMTLAPEQAPIIRIDLPDDFLHRSELDRRLLLLPHMARIAAALKKLDGRCLHALGYDPARKGDPAVMHLLALDAMLKRRSVLTIEMRRVPFAEQKAIVAEVMAAAPRLIGAAIDATGMGMNLAEDLGRQFGLREDPAGPGLVWMISLNPGWYNEAMPPLKAAFEDGTIILARDLEHLADLRLVKIIRGVPAIPPEREGETGKKDDRDTLFRAVAGIAGDCAAIIPDSMTIDFIESKSVASSTDLYLTRTNHLDQQVSKAVLGQTATTDAIAGGHAVGKEHRQVQEDIERADARSLAAVINRDLIRPWIQLEFTDHGGLFPRIKIGRAEDTDVKLTVDSVKGLVPLGLKVGQNQMREIIGIGAPADGDELLAAPAVQPAQPDEPKPPPPKPGAVRRETLHAEAGRDQVDAIAADADALAAPALDRLIDMVRALVDRASDLEELRAMLVALRPDMAADDLAAAMRLALVLSELSGRDEIGADG